MGIHVPVCSGIAIIGSVPAPFPAGELTNDLAQQQAWARWQIESQTWQSHLISTFMLPDPNLVRRRTQTEALPKIVTAVVSHTGASGIAWSATMLFHPAARLAQAIARSPVPVDIIVRCLWRGQPRPSGNGMGVRTVGLDDFGLPEGSQRSIIHRRGKSPPRSTIAR